MIDREHELPVTRQAKLLGLSRGAVYYVAQPVSSADLALRRRLDELHLEHPFMGATYIPMARGFVYLTAVVDVASRMVLAHKVAVTMEAYHAKEIIELAFARFGAPEIVNTDQGSQFTAEEFTSAAIDRGCKLYMDGRGSWRDNVFVERLWRSVKYECVYLKAYDGVSAARADVGRYLDWFNAHRAHSSLHGATPQQAYLDLSPTLEKAA